MNEKEVLCHIFRSMPNGRWLNRKATQRPLDQDTRATTWGFRPKARLNRTYITSHSTYSRWPPEWWPPLDITQPLNQTLRNDTLKKRISYLFCLLLVTTSKALVTSGDALVPSSLIVTEKAQNLFRKTRFLLRQAVNRKMLW